MSGSALDLQIGSTKAKEIYLRLLELGKTEQVCVNGIRFIRSNVITCTRAPDLGTALSREDEAYNCQLTLDPF